MFWLSLFFTGLHLAEELFFGPLWDEFGRITKVKIPELLAFLLFTVGLFFLLGGVSYGAWVCHSTFWLSVLMGARIGDSLFSHWFLYATGISDDNPGLATTVLYVFESFWIYWAILDLGEFHLVGFAIGAGFFFSAIPAVRLAGKLFPSWKEPRDDHFVGI